MHRMYLPMNSLGSRTYVGHLIKLIDFERLEGMQLKHQINLTVVEND